METDARARRVPRLSPGVWLIVATLLLCGAALFFRGPIRARYWAERIERSNDPTERARFAAALANAGDDAAWGVERLIRSSSGESRQFAAVILQHHKSDWARERLLTLLADADDGVRELAALGLAMGGDARMIPRLEEMYAGGDVRSAVAACTALERMGTAAAIAALGRLAPRPAEVEARAALVDALDGIRERACGPVLLALLTDDRECDALTRGEQRADRLLQAGIIPGAAFATSQASRGAPGAARSTIAQRAAAALERLSGIKPDGADAAATWRRWVESGAAVPASAPGGP